MHPILFQFGPLTIYSYGFFLALAFLASSMLAERQSQTKNFPPYFISNLCLFCLVSGIIGARIFFIILNFDFFKHDPYEIIKLWHGGLVWYGGLISGTAAGLMYMRIKKQAVFPVLDLMAPYLALGQAIGRIGCFLNGCCYGKIWPGVNIFYPTQVFSSLIMLFVFLVLRILQKRNQKTGNIFFLYLIFYSSKRFFVEFLRGDSPSIFLGLTVFQLISLSIFVSALGLLLFCKVDLNKGK